MTEKTSPPKKADSNKNAREIIAERKTNQQQTAPEKADKANWSLRILLIIVIFLLGSSAAIYFLPTLKDRIPVIASWVGEAPASESDSHLAEKIAALENRLTIQDADIQALKAADENLSAPDPLLLDRLDKLEQAEDKQDDISQSARIDMLLGRMSQLEASFVPLSKGLADAQEVRLERSQLATTATEHAEQLSNMETRLSKVEDFAARDNSGALIAFRIGELRRKITSGEPYDAEIDALKAMMSHGSFALDDQITEAISWLSQHKEGIVSADNLRGQFDNLIPTLIRAKSSHIDDPWWTRAYNSTKNLIMVRKTDNTAGENLDNIIAKAHQMLTRLDLKQALTHLEQLPANVREMLEVWIMQAEIYLQAEDELRRLESLTAGYYLEPEAPADSEEKPL